MKKAKLLSVIIPVLVSAFLIGGITQETKAASTYSTTETYYGAGYCYQDSSYNMIMQSNFGGSGDNLNTVISGYTDIISTTVTSTNVVSLVSNAYPTASDAKAATNGLGGYGNGGSPCISIRYTIGKTAYALHNTHTNHTENRVHEVYLFYSKS